MSTRSLTHIHDQDGAVLTTIYRHCDGYLSGHGQDLVDLVGSMRVVNGYSSDEPKPFANGMGCLAAQLVAGLKRHEGEHAAGNVYIYAPGSKDCWEEYTYHVRFDALDTPPRLTVETGDGEEVDLREAIAEDARSAS